MTNVYTVLKFSDRRKENTISIVGTYSNINTAYQVVGNIYQQKIAGARNQAQRYQEPLPDWVNNPNLLLQPRGQYFWGIQPQPVYQIIFDYDEEDAEGIAIVQNTLS